MARNEFQLLLDRQSTTYPSSTRPVKPVTTQVPSVATAGSASSTSHSSLSSVAGKECCALKDPQLSARFFLSCWIYRSWFHCHSISSCCGHCNMCCAHI